MPATTSDSRPSALRGTLAAITPVLVLLVHAIVASDTSGRGGAGHGVERAPLVTGPADSVAVVLILDAMREANATAELMPNLVSLGERHMHGPLRTCFGNFTLPCLLTAFEGRESPFVTSLRNFGTSASTDPNWVGAVRRRGLRLAVLGDHTLPELYPGHFVSGGNYADLGIPGPDRDHWAFAKTYEWIEGRQHDALVVHILGTDKVSHTHRAGADEYVRVYREADAFVGEVARRLDFERDTLIVFGDHGHGDEGHHDRKSWYVAAGPRFGGGTHPLELTSLLFLLSRIHGVLLPAHYEGELRWDLARPGDPTEPDWRRRQAAEWGLPDGAAERADLDAELLRRKQARDERPWRSVWTFLPWWIHLGLLSLALIAAFAGLRPLRRWWGFWQAGILLTAWLLPVFGPWLAVPAQAWASEPWRLPRKAVPALLAATLLAAATGLIFPWVTETFHIRAGFSFVAPAFYVAVIGVPLLLGTLVFPLASAPRLATGALFVVVLVFYLPGPGIYYYQMAQNTSMFLLPMAALSAVLLAWPLDRLRVLLLLALLLGLLFVAVEAGGWVWHYRIQNTVRGWPPWAGVVLGLLCLVPAALMWARRGWRAAALGAAAVASIGALMLGVFDYEVWRVAPFGILLVSLTGGLQLLERAREPHRIIWEVVLVAGLGFVLAWSASDGFYVRNLRIDFALKWIGEAFDREADLALAVGGLVAIRYFLMGVLALLAAALALGAERFVRLAPWVVLVYGLKVAAQAVQLLAVSFVEEEKISDLLIQEMLGMGVMAVLLWWGGLLAAGYLVVRRRSPGRNTARPGAA